MNFEILETNNEEYKPEEDTINQSNEENIPILGTDEDEFELSAMIYNLIH